MGDDLENLDLRVCARCEDDMAAEGGDLCAACKARGGEMTSDKMPAVPAASGAGETDYQTGYRDGWNAATIATAVAGLDTRSHYDRLDFRTVAGERVAVVPCWGERPAFIRDDDATRFCWDGDWKPASYWGTGNWEHSPAVILRAREQNGEEG